ncbi:MAG TPA: hypothetical protein VFI08_08120, partial [Spirochaetia bacterium]|nr:hypothetical protein [Spirochaetia bacterium]
MHLSRGLGLCALAAILSLWGCSPGGDTSRTFDATGAWSGTYAAAGSSGHTFTAQVVQNGTSLSGTISIPLIGMSGAALSGAVDGDSIQFGDIARTISFSGTAQADDTASGTYSISYGGAALSGAWSGTCVRTLFLVKTVSIPGGVGSGVGLAWDGSRMWVSATQQLAALSADGALLASYSYNDLQFPYPDFQSLAFDGSS